MNPLFEREWRSRWRPVWPLLQLVALIAAAGVILWLLVGTPNPSIHSVDFLRAQGEHRMRSYQAYGGLFCFIVGLLIGATSIANEKAAGTFEALTLCPFGPCGLIVGKLTSGAAFVSILLGVLFPLLAAVAPVWMITPGQLFTVELTHWFLLVQGLCFGVYGATRAKTLAQALGEAGALWGLLAAQPFTWGSATFPIIWALLSVGQVVYRWLVFNPLIALQIPGLIAARLVDVWLGALAAAPIFDLAFPGTLEHSALAVLCGQVLSIWWVSKWSIWQLSSPERDFAFHLRSLALVRLFLWHSRLELDRQRLELLTKRIDVSALVQTHLRPQVRAKKAASGTRLRLLKARWLQRYNPVLWLDLQRCLSLRAPEPQAQLPLLLFAAFGGSIAFAVSLATFVSLVGRIFGGERGNLSALHADYDGLRLALCYLALLCGPYYGTMGYVIERRSKMLEELRLTLLSARAIWWGKFAARVVIPLTLSLPGLTLVTFFAFNLPGDIPAIEVGQITLLVFTIAIWSLLSCLVLSYHAPSQLAAGVWCLCFGLGFGVLVWPLVGTWCPELGVLSPQFVLHHETLWAPCIGLYGSTATLCGLHLFTRLRQAGFG